MTDAPLASIVSRLKTKYLPTHAAAEETSFWNPVSNISPEHFVSKVDMSVGYLPTQMCDLPNRLLSFLFLFCTKTVMIV